MTAPTKVVPVEPTEVFPAKIYLQHPDDAGDEGQLWCEDDNLDGEHPSALYVLSSAPAPSSDGLSADLREHQTRTIANSQEARALMGDAADAIDRLEAEGFALAANQCRAGYGDDYGNHQCREIDRLKAENAALSLRMEGEMKALREALAMAAQMAGDAYWSLPVPKHWDRDKDQYVEWCGTQSKRIREQIAALASPTAIETPNALTPLRQLSAIHLAAELKTLEASWNAARNSDEELGGGSPLEWMVERMDEIDREIARRAVLASPANTQEG